MAEGDFKSGGPDLIVYLASPQDLFCKCQMIKIRDKPLFRDKIFQDASCSPNSNPVLHCVPFSRRNDFVISSDPLGCIISAADDAKIFFRKP